MEGRGSDGSGRDNISNLKSQGDDLQACESSA